MTGLGGWFFPPCRSWATAGHHGEDEIRKSNPMATGMNLVGMILTIVRDYLPAIGIGR
jgi:hypothetical protein